MARKNAHRALDLCILVLLTAFSASVIFFGHPSFLVATLLYFGLPSLFLVWRKPQIAAKAALAAVVFGLLWGFAFDYIAEFNHAWIWSPDSALVFPNALFGVVSLDIMVWYFLWVFLVVGFYEYFIETRLSSRISRNLSRTALFGFAAGLGAPVAGTFFPELITIEYTYFALGVLTLVAFGLMLARHPRLIAKLTITSAFFAAFYLCFELVALHAHLWIFTGTYLGTVELLGLRFPFEELLFWILLSGAIVASYYEFAIDDER